MRLNNCLARLQECVFVEGKVYADYGWHTDKNIGVFGPLLRPP
jgi:hypothetical protein